MAKAVKLSDIAAKIGVSTVTVSKALSGQKGMSDELRDRIVALADEMGYVRESAEQRKRGRKKLQSRCYRCRAIYSGKTVLLLEYISGNIAACH